MDILDQILAGAVKEGQKKVKPSKKVKPMKPNVDGFKEDYSDITCVPLSIVMMVEKRVCSCGNVKEVASSQPMVKSMKNTGCIDYSHYMTQADIDSLEKVFEYAEVKVDICPECFVDKKLKPKLDDRPLSVETVKFN